MESERRQMKQCCEKISKNLCYKFSLKVKSNCFPVLPGTPVKKGLANLREAKAWLGKNWASLWLGLG